METKQITWENWNSVSVLMGMKYADEAEVRRLLVEACKKIEELYRTLDDVKRGIKMTEKWLSKFPMQEILDAINGKDTPVC